MDDQTYEDSLEARLQAFIAQHGQAGIMPTSRALRAARCSALIAPIIRDGGFAAVAERLGLAYPGARRPAGYWDDFGHLEAELQNFATEHDIQGRMPTRYELLAAGRSDLVGAITKHGGAVAVAGRLGFVVNRPGRRNRETGTTAAPESARAARVPRTQDPKPAGYWDTFENMKSELLAFIAEHGEAGAMPLQAALTIAGRHDLVHAIYRHGGFVAVARRAGLASRSGRRPKGYWKAPENIAREVLGYIKEFGTPGVMPTQAELFAAGCDGLALAISKHGGGYAAVAAKLKLQQRRSRGRKAPGQDGMANTPVARSA